MYSIPWYKAEDKTRFEDDVKAYNAKQESEEEVRK